MLRTLAIFVVKMIDIDLELNSGSLDITVSVGGKLIFNKRFHIDGINVKASFPISRKGEL